MPNAKRSWPLLVLAGCSLIPGFGLFFGAAAVSWGLVNIQDFSAGVFRRPREYQYELSPDGRGYTVYGVGADGQPGTADDVYPGLGAAAAPRGADSMEAQ